MKGFTVLEIIIVLLVLAIVASAVIPKMIDTDSLGARVAAEVAATDIRAVQANAIFTGAPSAIVFTSGWSEYSAQGLLPPLRVLPSGATAGGSYSITFNGLGEPNFSSAQTLTFVNGGGSTDLTVEPLTGKVTVGGS
ncbi:MAG TPA: prepilin-type N-terminal cleavage/methylation domain-containing protein [bacterium]|nr:prepilin-type N-terminal cleavage/methylation domain-containing protein [bacterium]HPQ66816.1 prepilin-type N-terminal cleavage/methylation domain-containing protein [bacterium]